MNKPDLNHLNVSDLHELVSKEIAIFYKPILGKKELALLLGKSPKTIDAWVRNREIPYKKLVGNTYFVLEEILEWMDRCA